MIAIIDYGAGNLKSVSKALEKLGSDAVITDDPEVISGCSAIILPGVGAFGAAMENIRKRDLDTCIKKNVAEGKLFLGICLGMQLMFDRSYEDGVWEGLGLFKGEIVKFDDPALKIPHMGWNRLKYGRMDRISDGVEEGEFVYFVHSYYAVPEDWNDVILYAEYGVRVPGVVRKGNVIGMQFHPEKSSHTGLKLLQNFLNEAKENEQ